MVEKKNNKLNLGLEFNLNKDWKIYWKYPGDTGLSPSLKIKDATKNYNINIKYNVIMILLSYYNDSIIQHAQKSRTIIQQSKNCFNS